MATLKEKREELHVKQDRLAVIFEEAKTDNGLSLSPEQLDQVRQLDAELNDLVDEVKSLEAVDTIYQKRVQEIKNRQKPAVTLPTNGKAQDLSGREPEQVKSIGQQFVESHAYRQSAEHGRDGKFIDVDVLIPEYKTTMTTTAGYAPFVTRLDRVIDSAVRRVTVPSIIPQTTTSENAIKYMEETTFTNNAGAAAEGSAGTESALAWTERTQPVEKITTFIPVTDEQLADVPTLMNLIDRRLTLMGELAKETQILTGNGTTPNLDGFLNKTGVQTQALGGDTVPDAFYKAMTKVRAVGFADPSNIVIHPNDWQAVRLLKTTDGVYIWGNPSEAGVERMWGLPVLQTTAITENTGLVGDFPLYSEIFNRENAMIETSNSHSDNFTKGIQVIKITMRLTLAIYRAAAFCKVTGI